MLPGLRFLFFFKKWTRVSSVALLISAFLGYIVGCALSTDGWRGAEADLGGWYQNVLWGGGGDYSRFKLLRGIEKRKLVLCKYTSKVSRVFVRVSPFPSLPRLWPANGRKIVRRPLTPVLSAAQCVPIIAMVTVCHRGRSIGWSRLSVSPMARLNPPACSDPRLSWCCGNVCDYCLLWSWNTLNVKLWCGGVTIETENPDLQAKRWINHPLDMNTDM